MGFFDGRTAQDPIYAAIRDGQTENAREASDLVEWLWQVATPYVDHDIRRKAAIRFHAHFWEVYLAASLVQAGVPLVPRSEWRVRNGGPDLQMANPKVWIEAVTAGPGTGPDAVTQGQPGICQDVPDDGIKLRILTAIGEKVKKFEKYAVEGTIGPGDPCVVAVNTGTIPSATKERPDLPRIVRSLFPFGHEVIEISRHDGRVVGRRHEYQPVVSKQSGATVPTTGFETPGWSRISAVVHSAVDVFNGTSAMGQEFVMVHNPHPINALPQGLFKIGTEYWVEEQSIHGRRWWEFASV